jgi:hypothetical protein
MPYEVEHLANFGTGEPWVNRLVIELPNIVDVALRERRGEAKEAVFAVFYALTDAFNNLCELRRIEASPEIPVSERQTAFSSFYVHLWRAYRDRFQGLVRALGCDLDFLWQDDSKFEAGVKTFLHEHTAVDAELVEMLRDDRTKWQTNLATFRNHLEHHASPDPKLTATFYRLTAAELAFENVWEAIEDITILLVKPLLPEDIHFVGIPVEQRDPIQSRRFGWSIPSLAGQHPPSD